MKKAILFTLFFTILFLFLNTKPAETDEFVALDYYSDKLYKESYFDIKVYDFNISDLVKLKSANAHIISIVPKENVYNINNIRFSSNNIDLIIEESKNYYSSLLYDKNYIEEAIYIKNNGFQVSQIKILSTYEELINLESKINFKVLNT